MPKPFPYPFQVGIDICKWPRIKRFIQKYHEDRSRLDKWAFMFLVSSERKTFYEYFDKWKTDVSCLSSMNIVICFQLRTLGVFLTNGCL